MANTRGEQLAEVIRRKVSGLMKACEGVDEAAASRVPPGIWSPKQILSHLCGPEGVGHVPFLRAFLNGDTPELELNAGNPFFTDGRARMRFSELVAECEQNLGRVADFTAGLTDGQLARKAHVPELKESPLGEYPTLEGMICGIFEYHIEDHTAHLRKSLAMPSSNTVRLHRVLRATPEKVYRAFLDGDAMAKWLPPDGFTCRVDHMDARVGGTFRMWFTNFSTGTRIPFNGEYLELVPYERIRYTDRLEDPNLPGEIRTTVLLGKVSLGTDLTIVQEGVPEPIPPEACHLGWQDSLALLARLVEADVPD